MQNKPQPNWGHTKDSPILGNIIIFKTENETRIIECNQLDTYKINITS